MQLEKEKETREAAERCRLLAQRIAEELAPEAAAVLAADEESGALLEKALRRAGIRANSWTAAATVAADRAVSGVLMKVTGNRDCLRWYQKRAEKAREGG